MESRTTTRDEAAQPTTLVQTALLETAVKEMRVLRRNGRGRNAKPLVCARC
jgi:hypothetical protein